MRWGMNRKRARIGGAAAAMVALHATAGSVFAQTTPTLPPEEGGWIKWAIAGGVLAVVCLVGFLNAKRSHLA